ncbi:unnamed protein product [Diplocarpon coronariae]
MPLLQRKQKAESGLPLSLSLSLSALSLTALPHRSLPREAWWEFIRSASYLSLFLSSPWIWGKGEKKAWRESLMILRAERSAPGDWKPVGQPSPRYCNLFVGSCRPRHASKAAGAFPRTPVDSKGEKRTPREAVYYFV